ncbi:MAG: Rab geranylgeranyltransferase [Bogoriella megaspora]|nr:MAG: Rab geranylgeranyltransferase [Bogoriella megaspora]
MSHGIPRTTGATVKSEQARRQELADIETYKNLTKRVNDKISAGELTPETLELTTKLVDRNPEYYTIWNYRRAILLQLFEAEYQEEKLESRGAEALTPRQSNILKIITTDLQFEIRLLRKFPKCYWLWNHRNWLLHQAQSQLPSSIALQLWQGELALVGKMLSLDSRNFHGWGYRRTIVDKIEGLQGRSMAETEYEYTTKAIQSNLSNFSAWHYRSKLIPRMLNEQKADKTARRKTLNNEFQLIQNGLWTDPKDQSMWFYHQVLMKNVASSVAEESFVPDLSSADRLGLIEREIKGIEEMIDGAEGCKWIFLALLQYAQMYLEFDAGNKLFSTQDLRQWLTKLKELDPLRQGRWEDLEQKLNL